MPDGVSIPGGPSFAGSPQPPDVPCDPVGEGWRGPPGPPGAGSVISIATVAPGITGGPITTTGVLSVQWNAGAVTTLDTTLQLSGGTLAAVGAAPGGSAGGDLSGTYPSPTVARTGGVAFAASATTNTTNATNITTGTLGAARLPTTAVTAGTYTNTSLTVDATGRLTAASNGPAGAGSVTSVATSGAGISGGPITTTGTITVAWNAGAVSTVGSGLSLAAGVLTAPAPALSACTGTATYAQLPSEVQSVPISFPFSGKPATGQVINVPMAMALTIPSSLAGTVVYDTTKTTSGAAFTLNKISGGSTTALGTITITSTSNTSCTLAGAGGSLSAGDVLQIVAPTQDASLSDVGITVLAARV